MLRMRFLLLVFSSLLTASNASAQGHETPLPAARHLALHAAAAQQQGMPLILLVSLIGCPYCEEVRKLHLAPLEKTGVVVKQIHLDRDEKLIDFEGKPSTQKRFAKSLAVRVAPTVFFFDAKGAQVAEPIVGAIHEDFYKEYMDEAIATAKKKLSLTPEAVKQ